MKRIILFILICIVQCALCISPVRAGNTVITVEQVTEGVSLIEDVDYVITSTDPFTTAGSVDIVNTEHAVVILKNIKPSVVIKSYLKYIYINGKAAKNGTTCQVKMYAQGAIIMPYGSTFKPLTVYSEKNFEGTQNNTLSLGHSGGFMNSLANAWNNKIRSFKLKRGYMVTFAVGKSGWGYSRCFIADKEDLEIATLPNVLDGKISSYRIFQWYNAQKKGIADCNDKNAINALNASWCYRMWPDPQGLDYQPDCEYIPHHYKENYPTYGSLGEKTFSCHIKGNNEPGNSADEAPCSVDDVLANWEEAMRTGMRLLSESSHDGSMNHLKAFMDSIDARGWRCDILDLHCYWTTGTFNSLNWYLDTYGKGRPCWISEWIWGASWNHNGAFGSNVTDAQILSETKNLLNMLNGNSRIERYAYWNSESKAKIYNNGLTELGKYYAEMESGLGYNKANEYIPKVVYKNPSALTGTFNESTGKFVLKWNDPNGDMLDSIVVECKLPGSTRWTKCSNVAPKDKSSKNDLTYSYSDTPEGYGAFAYRVVEYGGNKKLTTNEVGLTRAAATAVGALQYGEITTGDDKSVKVALQKLEKAPYVVMGMITNKNTANGITNQVQTLNQDNFTFRFYPWQKTTPVTFKNAESVSYLVLPADTICHLPGGMTLISQSAGDIEGDEAIISFPEAFPEGVTPVVIAQQQTTKTTEAPVTVKVYDITNTGFKIRLVRQEVETGSFTAQRVNYFAATPGQESIGMGKMLTVGRNNETPIGGTAWQTVSFIDAAGEALSFRNPCIVAGSQTNNYGKASVFRVQSTLSNEAGEIHQANIRRQVDGTNTSTTESNNARTNGDYVGWFIISDDPNGNVDDSPVIITTGIEHIVRPGFNVSVFGRSIYAQGQNIKAFNANGSRVALGKPLPKGIYLVSNGKQTVKVQVR